jgi:hypothetical protein
MGQRASLGRGSVRPGEVCMTPEQAGCSSCHFNPANAGKTGGEVCPRLHFSYHHDLNQKVAAMVFKDNACHGEIHCCNQHNPNLGARYSRPCRGFIRVLLEHIESYQCNGYAAYLDSKGDSALKEDQIRFWITAINALEIFLGIIYMSPETGGK